MKQTIKVEVPEWHKAVYNEETQKVEVVKVEKAMVELPKSWEEFCENFPFKKGECVISYYGTIDNIDAEARYKQSVNTLPNKETAEAFLALMQLVQLRDCYRQGWTPDWRKACNKYCIYYEGNSCLPFDSIFNSRVLSFQSKEIRDEFLKNFRDLIEKAKALI